VPIVLCVYFFLNKKHLVTGASVHSMNKREKDNNSFPYERNPKSCACIPYGGGTKYYHSGILGGRINEFLELLDICEKMMDEDLNNHIIPRVHDESVFNKYLLDKNFLELSNFYIYPTVGKLFYKLNKKVKIIQRDKASLKYGGHSYLRGETNRRKRWYELIKSGTSNRSKQKGELYGVL